MSSSIETLLIILSSSDPDDAPQGKLRGNIFTYPAYTVCTLFTVYTGTVGI